MQKGFKVSGSDRVESEVTERLRNEGAIVHIGHDAGNVRGANTVVASAAITAAAERCATPSTVSVSAARRGAASGCCGSAWGVGVGADWVALRIIVAP